jgi:putative oxidoreductase
MLNLALLTLRVTTGALIAGHGAQKLFGAFGGHGLQGTGQTFDSIGLRPGRWWAPVAGATELGGGLLTLLGLFHPLGPLAIAGAMAVATATAHRGKPIWVTSGGAELPVTNLAIAAFLVLAGPGRYSADAALGTRLSRAVTVGAMLAGAGVLTAATSGDPEPIARRRRAA